MIDLKNASEEYKKFKKFFDKAIEYKLDAFGKLDLLSKEVDDLLLEATEKDPNSMIEDGYIEELTISEEEWEMLEKLKDNISELKRIMNKL